MERRTTPAAGAAALLGAALLCAANFLTYLLARREARHAGADDALLLKIGRASCRERV